MLHLLTSTLALLLCVTVAGAADEPLGKLSEKYESGGRGPGTVSSGKGDPGGVSYGTYQLASKIGRSDEFMKKYYPDEFAGLGGAAVKPGSAGDRSRVLMAGTEEFTKKWKELATKDPKALHANEHTFIKATHYDPQVKRLEKELKLDLNKRSAALRDVVWSVAVQHGPNTDVIVAAAESLVQDAKIGDVTDEALIRAIYAERGRKDKDGKLVRFKNGSEEWIPALTNGSITS